MDSCWLTVVAGALLAIWLFLKQVKKSKSPNFPEPPGHFLLGNVVPLFTSKPHERMLALCQQYGRAISMRLINRKLLLLTDPEEISRVLKGPKGVASKASEDYWFFNQNTVPECQSLVTAADDDPYWKVVRSALAPAFTARNLRSVLPYVTSITQTGMVAAAAVSKRTGFVDMNDVLLRITIDVLSQLAFGKPFGAASLGTCLELDVVERHCQVIQVYITSHPLRRSMIWSKAVREENRTVREFDALVKGIYEQLRKEPPPPTSLAAHLLAVKDPYTGGSLPDLRLRAELALFVIAGFETTGHTAATALFYIISQPGIEARITAELEALGLLATSQNPTPRPLQWEDLGKLRVLNAAIQETMRLQPSIPTGTARVLCQDMQLCGQMVPKGSRVWMPFYPVHRDPLVYPQPNDFIVERWMEARDDRGEDSDGEGKQDEAEAKRKGPRPVLTFSEGARNCIGMPLAKMEMTAALAQLLGSYKVELAPEMGGPQGFLDSLDMTLTLRPANGLFCRVHPRVPQ